MRNQSKVSTVVMYIVEILNGFITHSYVEVA